MTDCLVLPPACVAYVQRTGQLPILPDMDLSMLGRLIEVMCLEQGLDGESADRPPRQNPLSASPDATG